MKLKFLTAVIIALSLTGLTYADHLPKENFSTMSPTVKIVSYKYQFNGYVRGLSSGSGTVVSPDGLVITNHHVIYNEFEEKPMDAFEICITIDVQKEPLCNYTARLITSDKELDIALIQIDEKDVFGNALPDLKFLNYQTSSAPVEEQEVQVIGYPASGGETITITKGQISGFDEFNSYSYFKTDTDFDHGSSGGTALDAQGNYIGVPTYIRSYAENVGYFLDLREAQNWINTNKNKAAVIQLEAEKELKRQMKRFIVANDDLNYTGAEYPFVKVQVQDGWHFVEIDDDRFAAVEYNKNDGAGVWVTTEFYPFPIDEGYLNKLEEDLVDTKDYYPDFKKEQVTFAGQDAWKMSYTSYNQKNTIYYIPYGYTLVGISYGISLEKDLKGKQEVAIQPVLDSIQFTKSPQENPNLSSTVSFDNPDFQISVFDNWRIQKPHGARSSDLLAQAFQKDNFEGELNVYYSLTPPDERNFSTEDKLEDVTKRLSRSDLKVISKKDDVVLDGLKGYMYTYEYEGDLYQQIRKRMVVELNDDRYKFSIQYDDLADEFDANSATIEKMLLSFKYFGETDNADEYDFGTLSQQFSDIQFHRYATAITELADKGIVEGYAGGRFKPEAPVQRVEALKIILESKNHLEIERDLGKEIDFDAFAYKRDVLFSDVNYRDWFNKYVQYSRQEDIVSGYPNGTFGPGRSVNLAEALKMIVGVYEIPVWEGETAQWHKRYMDKAYELAWLPRDLTNPGHELTRAELSFLVNRVYNQAK